VWGERTLGTVIDQSGSQRVRFCQRPDTLFTYYVEEHLGPPPGIATKDPSWVLLRDGGLFTRESAMREDARRGLGWSRL
jgi:hypothetical protein